MKKCILSFLLVLCLALSLMPAQQASAACADEEYTGSAPYVWGGANIDGSNSGEDCSGFICRIYDRSRAGGGKIV